MTSVTKRFFVGLAIVGGVVAGSVNLAHAGVAVHGPYRWSKSNWPTGVKTGFTAMNGYCWLSGFSVGSAQNFSLGGDDAYVFIDAAGNWQVSGANDASGSSPPSAGTWAEAYCVDGQSGGQSLFQPWAGYQAVACPARTDHAQGGACYSVNVSNSSAYAINSVSDYTWLGFDGGPNFVFTNNYWTNAFVHIQGISYAGQSFGTSNQVTVAPQTQNGLYTYTEQPVSTWAQNNPSPLSVAYGAVWPFNDNKWFCAQGLSGQACTGVAVKVAAAQNGQAQAANIRSSLGYVCALQSVQTSAANGPVTVRLTNTYGDWNLSVAGPSYGGLPTSATAYCFPYPYATN